MYSVGGVGRCDTSVLRTADIYHLLDGWPTGYIRKTALELRSSPSLWFVRLNTWWVFSSHDVLPPLNSVVESFYVSVRVNVPLAGVCLFCAVTSLTVVFVKYIYTAEKVKNWRMLYVKEYSLNVFRFRCCKAYTIHAKSIWVFSHR